ncbi:hypothetical protein [Teredinibacter turnerae]|uniref:hypothetical protein n=1 Tax=Teredinibacter turnerae TaxID=2426 RepID=UPI0012BB548F|nr:hypothetical protein [Teredinibacter turnerae]
MKDSCLAYKNIWGGFSESEKNAREFIYYLWKEYQRYADPHFVTEFQKDFDARFWEMYLTVLLSEKFAIGSLSEGPDILIENHKIWVEAVTATPGREGLPDSVPEIIFNRSMAQELPTDKIILRLTSALNSKLIALNKYIKKGLVKNTEPYVVALNDGPIGWLGDIDNQRILKALFPLGDEYVVFDRDSESVSEPKFKYREEILKENKSGVKVNNFLSSEYELVSGVLYSSKGCFNIPKNCGSELVFVHNPMAKNPIEIGVFPVGSEYYGELGEEICTLKQIKA